MERPSKRLRVDNHPSEEQPNQEGDGEVHSTPASLFHPISPPRKRMQTSEKAASSSTGPTDVSGGLLFKSPFQLTRIRDLPQEDNGETVTLKDVLGDPLIAECWEFNFLHDIDFLMAAFDDDVRHLVKVHVVHGFWKREDENRRILQEQATRYENVVLHSAFTEMFGTHHSKMIIVLRHDETAQVIIHTANMIPRDWANMTQGVWRSPLLPLLAEIRPGGNPVPAVGSGERFQADLINYLLAYDNKRVTCKPLADQLKKFDFSAVRGALIASVPGRHDVSEDAETRWGWAAVKQALRSVPVKSGNSEVVVQVSSIATLGVTDAWLQETLFGRPGMGGRAKQPQPNFKIVFPTPDEIRRSLDGYGSGGSIHTKMQLGKEGPAQKQLRWMTPMLCHWGNDAEKGAKLGEDAAILDAGRKRAAPHIKTYIRYGEDDLSVDWALLTSANLSRQAWGQRVDAEGTFRIASWEIGVLVWPSLFADGAVMKVVHHTDTPSAGGDETKTPVVGLRVPYNLPLQRYGPNETPWVASASYTELDCKGQAW